MAINIKTGNNSKVALVSVAVNTIFDSTNLAIIIETDGASNKSYIPGRGFNPLTNLTAGKGYFIIAKQDIDREAAFNGSIPLAPVVDITQADYDALSSPNDDVYYAIIPE